MTDSDKQSGSKLKGKVVTLSDLQCAENKPHSKKFWPNKLLWSFIICVILPFIVGTVYYTTLASDRYAARAGFSIRGVDSGSGIDGIGALTGLVSSGSTTADSYIVLSYLTSRELLEAVDLELSLREKFSDAAIDSVSRLEADATVEAFLDYWQRRIHTQFDPTSGIIEFEAQSFDPEHARDIANTVLSLTQALINDLSAKARGDALRFAREEVDLQEERLRASIEALRDFRASEQSVDPSASAALDIQLIASLEARLIDLHARIDTLRQTLDEDAPSLNYLQRNAEALSRQITERRNAIGNSILDDTGINALTQQLALYEELEVEQSFSQQSYASSLVSLEQARRDADRQQRYLAIHMQPQVSQSAAYPRRVRNILVLSFILIVGWSIGALVVYSVRDHLT